LMLRELEDLWLVKLWAGGCGIDADDGCGWAFAGIKSWRLICFSISSHEPNIKLFNIYYSYVLLLIDRENSESLADMDCSDYYHSNILVTPNWKKNLIYFSFW
jgi:hypothetical protein